MISFLLRQIGVFIPNPFYNNFPKSIRELSSDCLLFDQLIHYNDTYGMNNFDNSGHSHFEYLFERTAFKEISNIREFTVVTEDEAVPLIREIVNNLLCSSRPLNDRQYNLVLSSIFDYEFDIECCASKNTVIKLLADTQNIKMTNLIMMSDIIKLVEYINYRYYNNKNIKKLNLKNKDRKFITKVINELFNSQRCDIKTCSEKKALWNGLLHHIHYQPFDELSNEFVNIMRGKRNISAYSDFECAMAEKDIKKAVNILKSEKSSATVLRNLDYILSRCSNKDDINFVLNSIDTDNIIVLIQLFLKYSYTFLKTANKRVFTFTSHNKTKVHYETDDECIKRRTVLPPELINDVANILENNLRKLLSNRLGKVYIAPAMKQVALPIQENATQGGVGVLSKGSKIKIENEKKIRAFTYWEKVDDIDLSVIGIDEQCNQTEFSWRTMFNNQSDAIAYSGDQTSGFYGGSEYFDVDVEKFKTLYPDIKYLIFCNNVYSGIDFNKCFCKAGYMVRDIQDSGEVFEPKTVESSFLIDCESTFAYLFGINLSENQFVWLNSAQDGKSTIAGANSLSFLLQYFELTSIINMYSFFEMMATEVVDDPLQADVIVSDYIDNYPRNAKVIRSFDFDKILALMNK